MVTLLAAVVVVAMAGSVPLTIVTELSLEDHCTPGVISMPGVLTPFITAVALAAYCTCAPAATLAFFGEMAKFDPPSTHTDAVAVWVMVWSRAVIVAVLLLRLLPVSNPPELTVTIPLSLLQEALFVTLPVLPSLKVA